MLLLCSQVVWQSVFKICVYRCICSCMSAYALVFYCAFVQAALSPDLQTLAEGRKSSWTDGVTSSKQNHRPGSETEKQKHTKVSELKEVSGSQTNIQTKTQERMNSCLTIGAADQQTVTDWQTLSWRWRCGHCATPSQLAHWNRICFSDPMGTHWKTLRHPYIWTSLRASAKRN